MKKIVKISIIILAVSTLSSCNKFLSLSPPHMMTMDNAISSYDGAVSILNGMYASLSTGSGSSIRDYFGGGVYVALSAQAGVSRANSSSYYGQVATSTYAAFSNYWSHWFGCVNCANAAINSIQNLSDDKFPTPQTKAKMLGEARAFRAWTYSHLLWCFSHFWADDEYGVLWREEVASLGNIIANRISVKDSYVNIFADIDAGIAVLPDYTISQKLSKQMAQAIKAKLLLYRGWEGDYQAALVIVNDILATAPSNFKMDPDMKKMYKDAWDSQEVLFAKYMEDGTGRAYGEGTYSQTIIQSGDLLTALNPNNPSSLKSFFPVFDNWIKEDPRYGATMGWARAISATGLLYFCPTKLAREGRPTTDHMNDKFATYYFRYPELYLMQAELRARTNASIASCIEPLNIMRSKRTNPVLPQFQVPATREELMELIFKEYCLELYMENGSEWFAALRFQKDNNSMLSFMKPDVPEIESNRFCWPIPSSETGTNSLIKSNPGYDN